MSDDSKIQQTILQHDYVAINDIVPNDAGNLAEASFDPYAPLSSNDGGNTEEINITDQNTVSTAVGSQGHWGIDEDTG